MATARTALARAYRHPALTLARTPFLLDDGVVFLNHGSFGACPEPVLAEYQGWQRELEREPVDFIARRLTGLLDDVLAQLGAFVGAGPEGLALLPNATAGVNVAARSLELRPGDEVLSTDHEYGAMRLVWQDACARAGATWVEQPVAVPCTGEEQIVEAVWAGVTPHTRALFLSHVTSPTAIRFPVEELCRRAREAGILSVVDGAHGPGQLDLNLEALGADVYAGNCHNGRGGFARTSHDESMTTHTTSVDESTRTLDPRTATVVGYVRVSRVAGREGDSFQSPQTQEQAIRDLSERRGYAVSDVVHELDASGGTMDRPELQRILTDIREGRVQGVVVYNLTRFARSLVGGVAAIEDVIRAGGFVVTCDGTVDTSSQAGPMADLVRNVLLSIAEMERGVRREGFENAKRNAVARGVHISGTVPVGYRRGEDARLVLDTPERVAAVREAFTMRAEGASLAAVSARLDETIPGGPNGNRAKWLTRTVRQLLGNRVYTGQARQGEHTHEGAHPAIVDAQTFQRAQAVNRKAAKLSPARVGRPALSLLAGIARCEGCGGSLTRSKVGGKYHVYRCRGDNGCKAPVSCAQPALDKLVADIAVERLSAQGDTSHALTWDDSADIPALIAALDAARAYADSLSDPAMIAALRTPERIALAVDKADAAVREAQDALDAASPDAEGGVTLAVEDWRSLPWEMTPVEDRRRYIGRVVPRVTVKRAPRGTPLSARVALG